LSIPAAGVTLFPNRNRKRTASYKKNRADGAFIVSASCENGVIKAEITSENGCDLTIANPYSDKSVTVSSVYGKTTVEAGGKATIKTSVGEKLIVE